GRLCGLEVDDEFDFGRLLDWQIGWLLTFENAPCIVATLAARSRRRRQLLICPSRRPWGRYRGNIARPNDVVPGPRACPGPGRARRGAAAQRKGPAGPSLEECPHQGQASWWHKCHCAKVKCSAIASPSVLAIVSPICGSTSAAQGRIDGA